VILTLAQTFFGISDRDHSSLKDSATHTDRKQHHAFDCPNENSLNPGIVHGFLA